MSPHEFANDQRERLRITSALIKAIPLDVRYSNIVVALTDVLAEYLQGMSPDDNDDNLPFSNNSPDKY